MKIFFNARHFKGALLILVLALLFWGGVRHTQKGFSSSNHSRSEPVESTADHRALQQERSQGQLNKVSVETGSSAKFDPDQFPLLFLNEQERESLDKEKIRELEFKGISHASPIQMLFAECKQGNHMACMAVRGLSGQLYWEAKENDSFSDREYYGEVAAQASQNLCISGDLGACGLETEFEGAIELAMKALPILRQFCSWGVGCRAYVDYLNFVSPSSGKGLKVAKQACQLRAADCDVYLDNLTDHTSKEFTTARVRLCLEAGDCAGYLLSFQENSLPSTQFMGAAERQCERDPFSCERISEFYRLRGISMEAQKFQRKSCESGLLDTCRIHALQLFNRDASGAAIDVLATMCSLNNGRHGYGRNTRKLLMRHCKRDLSFEYESLEQLEESLSSEPVDCPENEICKSTIYMEPVFVD